MKTKNEIKDEIFKKHQGHKGNTYGIWITLLIIAISLSFFKADIDSSYKASEIMGTIMVLLILTTGLGYLVLKKSRIAEIKSLEKQILEAKAKKAGRKAFNEEYYQTTTKDDSKVDNLSEKIKKLEVQLELLQ